MNPEILQWDSKYEIGIEEVDLQHRYFTGLIKRLSIELKESESIDHKNRPIKELVYYAKFHFLSEENLMIRYGYLDVEKHKVLHLSLINELNSRRFSNTDVLLDFLMEWFIIHTTGEDKRFGQYVARNTSK